MPTPHAAPSSGLSSVDIAVLWLPCDVVELICLKPTTRLALFLSLGIPVVFKATASYTDIVALSGYPFIAHNVSHAMKLVVSPVCQAAAPSV